MNKKILLFSTSIVLIAMIFPQSVLGLTSRQLTVQNASLRKQVVSLKKVNTSLRQENTILMQDNLSLAERNDILKFQNFNLAARVVTTTVQVATLKAQTIVLKERNTFLETLVTELRNQVRTLFSAISAVWKSPVQLSYAKIEGSNLVGSVINVSPYTYDNVTVVYNLLDSANNLILANEKVVITTLPAQTSWKFKVAITDFRITKVNVVKITYYKN